MLPLAAVDVGGTFTDLLLLAGEKLVAVKVPSTRESPELGVLEALTAAGAIGAGLVHGSTVAINTVLERMGARTAFIATEGGWQAEKDGKPGINMLSRGPKARRLPSRCNLDPESGESIQILTPGGGWGEKRGARKRYSEPPCDPPSSD